jgi:hypothetical protein
MGEAMIVDFDGSRLASGGRRPDEMRDVVTGSYSLPWEQDVMHVDGTSCGFAPPERTYEPRP